MKRYLLPIIVSAVSLVVIAVVSYAYFTATIDPSGETTATIRTATVGTVTFITESPSSNLTNVYPGWEGTGSTTVYFNTNSDDDVAYHCTVKLESGSYATNVYVQTLSGSDAQVPAETALTEQGVVVSQGTLDAQSNIASPNHGDEHVVTYKIIFKEIGQAQNDDQGRTINTYTTCVIDQQSGSALTLVSGTMTDLSGDPIANQAMVAFSSPTYFTTDANGHYEVRLAAGAHNIYYVPGYTMEQTVAAGTGIQSNQNVITKTVTVTDGNTQTLNPVININAPTKTVSVTCTNCTIEGETSASQTVTSGENASFDVVADEGYTLEGAIVTGDCALSNGTLTLTNVTEDAACTISSALLPTYVYWTAAQSGSGTQMDRFSYPATGQDEANFSSLNLSQPGVFIRTSIVDNVLLGHEACLYYNNNRFCLGPNYWVSDDDLQTAANKTERKLKSAMESALGTTKTSYGTNISFSSPETSYARCNFGSGYCYAYASGDVLCNDGSKNCSVNASGTASCD